MQRHSLAATCHGCLPSKHTLWAWKVHLRTLPQSNHFLPTPLGKKKAGCGKGPQTDAPRQKVCCSPQTRMGMVSGSCPSTALSGSAWGWVSLPQLHRCLVLPACSPPPQTFPSVAAARKGSVPPKEGKGWLVGGISLPAWEGILSHWQPWLKHTLSARLHEALAAQCRHTEGSTGAEKWLPILHFMEG